MGISNCCEVNRKVEARLIPFTTTNFINKSEIKESINARILNKQFITSKLNQIQREPPESDEENKIINNELDINDNDINLESFSEKCHEEASKLAQNSDRDIQEKDCSNSKENDLLNVVQTNKVLYLFNETQIEKNKNTYMNLEKNSEKEIIQENNEKSIQFRKENKKMTIDDVLVMSKFEKADNSQIIYEDELLKYKPGILISYIPRFCQVTKEIFIYFKNKYSANCWLGKPILTIPLKYVINIKKSI